MRSKLNRKQTLAYLKNKPSIDWCTNWAKKIYKSAGRDSLNDWIHPSGMAKVYRKSATPEFGEALTDSIMQHYEPACKCEICGEDATETYTCRDCEKEYCHKCSADYNPFTQIDYNCCSSCGQSKAEGHGE